MAYPYIPAKSISYGGTRALNSVKYIVIHYTGNDNDTALANCNFFKNSNTRSAGCHWFVDRSGAVYQSIDMKRIAWSVGGFFTQANGAGSYYKKCTNTNSVSIEMCDVKSQEPSGAQVAAIKKLVAYIQSECPNAKTIIRHWDVNGKSCPARMTGTNNEKWNTLKAQITGSASITNTSSTATQKPAQQTNTTTPKPTPASHFHVGSVYTTQVSDLNVRTGAGTGYRKKSRSELTADGRKHADSQGQFKKGTRVTCKAVKTVGNQVWIRTPSGWLCAYNGSKYYVY